MITHKHDCFEKIEEPHSRCRPSGASSYTRCQYQRKYRQTRKLQIPDCCICTYLTFLTTINLTCLFAVSTRQALFITPCSHTFHYKCVKPLIEAHHPAFSCPLCRIYADLKEGVEVEPTDLDDADDADVEIDDSPSNAVINKGFADAANQSDKAGVATTVATPTSRPIYLFNTVTVKTQR